MRLNIKDNVEAIYIKACYARLSVLSIKVTKTKVKNN